MKLLGLTGGVGMGKSAAASFLARHKCEVVDTDELARAAVAPGQPALARVLEVFGGHLADSSGALRRDELAKIVFAHPDKRHQLEAILHPVIRATWLRQVEQWRAAGRPVGAVVIPLLFETKAEDQFDKIICVACTLPTQMARLQNRGWDAEAIALRRAAQWPINQKMERSDFVVWTEPSLEVHAQQIETIWRRV